MKNQFVSFKNSIKCLKFLNTLNKYRKTCTKLKQYFDLTNKLLKNVEFIFFCCWRSIWACPNEAPIVRHAGKPACFHRVNKTPC